MDSDWKVELEHRLDPYLQALGVWSHHLMDWIIDEPVWF